MQNKTRQGHSLLDHMDIIDEYVYISKTNKEGIITYASKAFAERCGFTIDELIGNDHNIIRHPDMPDDIFKELWETILSGEKWIGEIKNLGKDGTPFWAETTVIPNIHEGEIQGYISIRQDITDKKTNEALAITDALTGLSNRHYYKSVIIREISRAKRDGKNITFIMSDVDFFKKYNDTYGHQEGDKVLRAIALTLKNLLHRGGDYVFRMGGEEFAILVSDLDEPHSTMLGEKIRSAVESLNIPHSKNSASPYVTLSIGIMVADPKRDVVDEETIYKTADEALYQAKEQGRNRCFLHQNNELELF